MQKNSNRNSQSQDTEFGTEQLSTPEVGGTVSQNESYRGKPIRQLNPLNESSEEFHSKQISAVRKKGSSITAVQFQDGSTVDIEEAIALAEEGYIEGVNTGATRESDGRQKTLRSYPDGDPDNNLDKLPNF